MRLPPTLDLRGIYWKLFRGINMIIEPYDNKEEKRSDKKDTILHLDEDVVERARELDLDLSEIAENAIRMELKVHSHGKYFDPPQLLEDMRRKGLVYKIPLRVERLGISDLGPFKSIETRFKDKNIILGSTATGKTTMINAIKMFFDNSSDLMGGLDIKISGVEPKINLIFEEGQSSVSNDILKHGINEGDGCLLLDDCVETLSMEGATSFLRYLSRRQEQIIVTYSLGEYLNPRSFKEFERIDLLEVANYRSKPPGHSYDAKYKSVDLDKFFQ